MAEAQPPQRRGRLLKVAGIVAAAVIGVAALALIGVNAYVRVAYAPFYEAATDEFPLPGLDAGFVPQDLDYLDEAGAWLFSGYQAKDGPSPLYRRDADGTVARLTVALPDGSSYQGHGSARKAATWCSTPARWLPPPTGPRSSPWAASRWTSPPPS